MEKTWRNKEKKGNMGIQLPTWFDIEELPTARIVQSHT